MGRRTGVRLLDGLAMAGVAAAVIATSGCASGGKGDAQKAHDQEIEAGRKRREQMDREERERQAANQEAAKRRQADADVERARARKEFEEKQQKESAQLEAAQKAREERRAEYARKRDAAMKNVQAAKLLDLVNDPGAFAGKAVRVNARWVSTEPDPHDDGFNANELSFDMLIPGGDPQGNSVLVTLAPSLKVSPTFVAAIDYANGYAPRAAFFKGVRGSEVELVLFVREKVEAGVHAAEIVEVKAK